MTLTQKFASVAAVALAGTAVSVVAPATASAAEPCILGSSNTAPSCVQRDLGYQRVFTLGNGICAGLVTTQGTAYDGPRNQYADVPGATHAIELTISNGFTPLGPILPPILNCDVLAVYDWRNLDTGQTGSVSRFVPANLPSQSRLTVTALTGPGRVSLTMRTDRPSIPVNLEVLVP